MSIGGLEAYGVTLWFTLRFTLRFVNVNVCQCCCPSCVVYTGDLPRGLSRFGNHVSTEGEAWGPANRG